MTRTKEEEEEDDENTEHNEGTDDEERPLTRAPDDTAREHRDHEHRVQGTPVHHAPADRRAIRFPAQTARTAQTAHLAHPARTTQPATLAQ
ncbi:MAG: hypothetical protein QOE16_932 [Microbacteriaceae bacterium]|nr:hypothetical protein [Microbacteriaceae bacterium]